MKSAECCCLYMRARSYCGQHKSNFKVGSFYRFTRRLYILKFFALHPKCEKLHLNQMCITEYPVNLAVGRTRVDHRQRRLGVKSVIHKHTIKHNCLLIILLFLFFSLLLSFFKCCLSLLYVFFKSSLSLLKSS